MQNRYATLTNIPSRFTTPLGFKKNGDPIYLIGGGSIQSLEQIPPGPAPVVETPPAPPAERYFTAEDVQRARAEEKDKLYQRLEQEAAARRAMEEQVNSLLAAQQAEAQAQAEARAQAEAEARAKAEAEMDARTLLQAKEQEWQAQIAATQQDWEQKFQQIQAEREQERAVLEKDRQLAEIQAYAASRVAQEQDNIAPELLDFISGNTPEEIDASIERVKAKSLEIAQAAQAQLQAVMPQQRGVSPTGYAPVGPLESQAGTRQYSAEDIKNMDIAEYAQLRQKMGIGSQVTNRGLFG